MRLTTRHVLTGVLWLGLMPPVCAAADQPGPEATLPQPTGLQATGPQATGPQATGSQGTVPQATGPQAMWQQSMAPQATAPESIPPGQPTGPTVSSAPASANGPASAPAPTATQSQAPQEDNASWYAGTFGPGCSTPPCCEICGGGSGPPPDYYVEADLRVLGRDRPKETPTITFERKSGDPSAQPTITQLFGEMSFKVINDGISPGMQGTIGHYLGHDSNNRDEFIEFTYWGLDRWQGTATMNSNDYFLGYSQQGAPVVSTGNLYSSFPFDVGGFNRANTQTLSEQSDLNNWELNYRFGPRSVPDHLVLYPNGRWRRECRPGLYCSYFAGLRIIEMNDAADFFSQGSFEVNGVRTPDYGNYSVSTRNRLIGCQLGGELTYRHCLWNIDLHGRLGPYLNMARSESSIVTHAVGIDPIAVSDLDTQESIDRDTAALVGEFGIAATYKIRPNLIARASYDFIWLDGLVLAPEQFVFQTVSAPQMDNRGVMFVNGVTLGLEYTW